MARKDKRAQLTGRVGVMKLRHVRIHHWVMGTPAWRSLDTVARCAYVELLALYNGSNNGRIALAVRPLATALNVSVKTAARALSRLKEMGFVEVVMKGAFHCKVRAASEYRLTEFDCDVTGAKATKAFARVNVNGSRGDTESEK